MADVNVFEVIKNAYLRPPEQRLDTPRKEAIDVLSHCGFIPVDRGEEGVDLQFVFPRIVVRNTEQMLARSAGGEAGEAKDRLAGWGRLVTLRQGGEQIIDDARAFLGIVGVPGDKVTASISWMDRI